MDTNVGGIDRISRFVIGVLLGAVGIAVLAGVLEYGTAVGAVALVVGLVLVVTGALQSCPAYRLLGVDTCKRK
ncbi:MAG: YgaP family membrane protein [Natrialbaceae archaeon]